jgi:hypothetical protein
VQLKHPAFGNGKAVSPPNPNLLRFVTDEAIAGFHPSQERKPPTRLIVFSDKTEALHRLE